MSELKTNKVSPATSTALAIGDSGDTITVPSGATLDISASTLTPPATMPASSGVNFTALNATNLGSGTVPTARLGTGSASSSVFLRGDSSWVAAGGTNTPAFMATCGSSQSVADDTITKVEMSVEIFDTDSTYDPTTNYRWTPGVVGKYQIGFSVYMEGNTIHRQWTGVYKNGSAVAPKTNTQAYTGGGYHYDRSTQANSCLIDVTDVADYFEVFCWIDTDNSSATSVQDPEMTFFWGYRLLT